MFKKIKISTLSLPDLNPYRTLKRPIEHKNENIFVAEGKKLIERLLNSKLQIQSMLITEEWIEYFRTEIESRKENFKVFVGEKALLSEIVGFQLHQGLMAVANIPAKIDLVKFIKKYEPSLLVAVDGIMNSENLGVIVRNCAAFNVDALIIGETSADPFLRRSVRNSMGNIFRLPIIYSENLLEDLIKLKSEFRIPTFAAHTSLKSKSIYKSDFKNSCCILFGNEESGPRTELLNFCEWFMIPMKNKVDSINVANATAVALYEVQRQRSAFNFK